jgi:hypothetical protein
MMPISALRYRIVAVSVAAFVLAACGGTTTQSLPISTTAAVGPGIVPAARRGDLLYVSSFYSSEVDVFSYPRGQPVATLTGFEDPNGMCADKAGDVWVTNTDASNLIEYAHGGSSPIKTLPDTGYYPVACSVDPATGNLAVSNLFTTSDTDGNVVVYVHASGTGKPYTVAGLAEAFFIAYDGHGNLFVDGHPVLFGSGVTFAELRKGGRSFKSFTVPPSIVSIFPSYMQWDGTYLALTGQGTTTNAIYRLAIERHHAIVKGTVQIVGGDGGPFWIQGQKMVMVSGVGDQVWIWKYPAGGKAIKYFMTGLDDNNGVTVSLGPR